MRGLGTQQHVWHCLLCGMFERGGEILDCCHCLPGSIAGLTHQSDAAAAAATA